MALGETALLAGTSSTSLRCWGRGGADTRIPPTSIPASKEQTRRGYTEVVEKRLAHSWTSSPSMRERFPARPEPTPGSDPRNPLGACALYLSWPYYRIHGIHDTRNIGRPSSDGCLGPYKEHITQLFDLVPVGTPARIV